MLLGCKAQACVHLHREIGKSRSLGGKEKTVRFVDEEVERSSGMEKTRAIDEDGVAWSSSGKGVEVEDGETRARSKGGAMGDKGWRDETARSSISHGLVSKIKPNLPNWGIKGELRGIMVNKGRIHREFRYFRDIFWNLVKLRWEIRENGVFRKKTSKRIHRIKNHRIWTWFRGEIANWSGEKFSDVKIVI